MRDLPNLNEKNKERPLCFSYSIKARALIFAHLSRMKLPQETLEVDKNIVIKKSPALIHEFIQCVSQMTMLALAGRISRSPTLDTLESAMKLCPAIIQAVWDSKSPFLQLPHITEDMLRYFTVKKSKQYVRSMTQLATMNNQDRRSMLSKLTDEQYEDVMAVLGNMPHLEADVKTEVLDDEESGNITAGSIVTVTVTLTRRPMSSLFVVTDAPKVVATKVVTGEHLNGDANLEKENQLPVWDKKGKVSKKLKKQKSQQRKLRVQEKKEEKEKQRKEDEERRALISTEDNEGINGQENQQQSDIESSSDHESEKEQEVHSGTESDDEADMHDLVEEDKESISDSGDDDAQDLNDDDDEAWERFQKKQNKKANDSLETKAKMSHSVHCPFFTDDKQEFWWIYLSDHKKRALTTIPVLLTNLVDTESIDLKLTAPPKPGSYQYSVVIRSDSYIDFDIIKTIKVSLIYGVDQ
jgi:translocation protein SEC63